MTLATKGDPIPADVRAALHGGFGAVPGVSVQSVSIVARSAGSVRLSAFVTGWSPSLHAVDINYLADVPLSAGAFTAAAVRRRFSWATREQRRRGARALSLGRALPLPLTQDPVTGSTGPHLAHLHMDRALPILAELDGEDLATTVADAVREMHLNPDDSNGGPRLASDVASVTEVDGRMVLGCLVPIDTVQDVPCTFDGDTLLVGGGVGVPATVMAVLPGRRLRDVIRVHPALDDRLILEAGTGDQGDVALRIATDLAPLPEVLPRAGGTE